MQRNFQHIFCLIYIPNPPLVQIKVTIIAETITEQSPNKALVKTHLALSTHFLISQNFVQNSPLFPFPNNLFQIQHFLPRPVLPWACWCWLVRFHLRRLIQPSRSVHMWSNPSSTACWRDHFFDDISGLLYAQKCYLHSVSLGKE